MKIKFKPNHMFNKLRKDFSAPAALCLIAFFAVSIEGFIPYENRALRETLSRIGSASMFGLVLSTAVCTLRERIRRVTIFSWMAGSAGVALYLLEANNSVIEGLALAALAICFWGACGKEAPALRLNQICGWFFTCLGVSIVVYLSLTILESAVTSLFFSRMHYATSNSVSQTILLFSFLVFAPWMFLGGLPDEDTPPDKREGFHKLNARVLLPLSLALMAVLLVYVGKIILSWTMPVGTMNGFALTALALFTFFHLTLSGEENRISAWFVKWGGWIMLPVLVAQQVGVWIRVQAYGLTDARVLGIVMTILCAAVVVSALLQKRANWFFPAAAVLALIFVASPLNVANLARLNQESRLTAALQRNSMLTEDGVVIANAQADIADRTIIYDSMEYVLGQDAPEGSLTAWLNDYFEDDNGDIWYNSTEKKFQLLGFAKTVENNVSYSFRWSFDGTAEANQLDTRGYDHAEWINVSASYSSAEETFTPEAVPEEDSAFFICDVQALVQALMQAEDDFIFPDIPLTLSINGDQLLLNPLLDSTEVTPDYEAFNRAFYLLEDKISFPSGQILYLSSLNISHYTSSSTTYLSLRGWLLTPSAE